MQIKTYFWLTVGVSLLVFISPIMAQEEQWLQYHSERQAERILGDMRTSNLRLSSEKPRDIELPDFKCEEPFFTYWSTPMVESGRLLIALDRSAEQGKWDRLFIDSNGNNSFSDEEAIEPYQTDQYRTYFGPVKVVFEGEDGPLTYHLNFEFYQGGETRRLYVSSGCWYEGEITVDGQKKHCVLIDYNCNGTFDDKSLNYGDCDRVRIGRKDTRDTGYVGNYVDIDDTLYSIEIARDGAYIMLTKAEDVKYGNVRLPETITEFSAGGENGLFRLKLDKGVGSLPVGKYRISTWKIERKDDKGKRWALQGRSYSKDGDFEITEAAETFLETGEPIKASLQVRLNSETKNYEFAKVLRGPLGENIDLTSGGRDVRDLWKMSAKNKEGTFAKIYPIPDQ